MSLVTNHARFSGLPAANNNLPPQLRKPAQPCRYLNRLAVSVLLVAKLAATEVVLMDYDDGDAGNGMHDANINSGDIGVQDWVGTHQYQSNNNSGIGSDQNLALGANRNTAHTLSTTGYAAQVGHTLTASFMWRAANAWDPEDRPVFSIFYTDDDTIEGASTTIFSYEVTTSNDTTYRVEDVPSHVITDPLAAGKTLFVNLGENESVGSGEFYRADNVFVSVEDTPVSPILKVNELYVFANSGSDTTYSIPVSSPAGPGVTTDLTITGATPSGSAAGNVAVTTPFDLLVAPNGSSQIDFTFTPVAGVGIYNFDLEIASDDALETSPRTVSVQIEVGFPLISLDSDPIDLGTLASNPGPQVFTIDVTNTSDGGDLTINSSTSFIDGDAEFQVTSYPGPIAPGATDEIEITFTPGTAEGLFTGKLKVLSDDYFGSEPEVPLRALVFPAGENAAVDFGTSDSSVEAGYSQFIVSEDASQTEAGVGIRITSRDVDVTGDGGASGSALLVDFARTTFNGGGGNYISIILTGLDTGTLNLLASLNYDSSLGLPLDLAFGEEGQPLFEFAPDLTRPGEAQYSTSVASGKTYELRIIESGNANLAYISGLLLWGDAVPGGTPYGNFVSAAGLDPTTTGLPDLDPDLDGIDTGIEWVVGGSPNDPANPDTAKLPTGTLVYTDPDEDTNFSDYLRFTYRLTDAAAADSGTSINVEYGSTLTGWDPASDGVDGVVIVTGPSVSGVSQVDVYIPVGPSKLFARLKVEL